MMSLKPLPVSIFNILIFGVALGFLLAFRTYIPYLYWGEADNYIWTRYSLPSIINYSLWPFLIPFVYHYSYQWPLGSRYSIKSNIMAVVCCILFSLLHEFVSNVIYFVPLELMDWYHLDADSIKYLKGAVPAAMINRVVEYWIIIFTLKSIDNFIALKKSETKVAKVQAQLTGAKLKALRMQLQPHFLFNTLNSISALLDIDAKKARSVIAKFAEVLRNVLESESENFIELSREIANTRSYLEIERVRFSDRLSVMLDIEKGIESLMVPSLILQPLVENSIKHGLSGSGRDLQIKIIAKRIENKLELVVEDNGQVSDNIDVEKNERVGLKNTRERLESLFDQDAYIKFDTTDGFHTTIGIPILKSSGKKSARNDTVLPTNG